ncbi:MAG TPA: helix-turn-helix transcriptional regulator [Chryseosolibacter sp.]
MKSERVFKEFLLDVGTKLTELREEKGYTTIKEFVTRYDLPEIQYWRIEKGKANITVKSLVKILAIHKLSPRDFFEMLHNDGLLKSFDGVKKKKKVKV